MVNINYQRLADLVKGQLVDPAYFLGINDASDDSNSSTFDILELSDGRTYEQYSQPHLLNGKNVGRVWSFRDVSERKKVEEFIRRSNERFELISRTTNDAVWEWNLAT